MDAVINYTMGLGTVYWVLDLPDWQTKQPADSARPTGRLAGQLARQLISRLTSRPGRLSQLLGRLANRPASLADWPADRLIAWPIDWTAGWLVN